MLKKVTTMQAQNRMHIEEIEAGIKRIISECENGDKRPEVLKNVLELYALQLKKIIFSRVQKTIDSSENYSQNYVAMYSEEQSFLLDDIQFCAAAIKEEIETNQYYYESDECARLALRLFANNVLYYYRELAIKIMKEAEKDEKDD